MRNVVGAPCHLLDHLYLALSLTLLPSHFSHFLPLPKHDPDWAITPRLAPTLPKGCPKKHIQSQALGSCSSWLALQWPTAQFAVWRLSEVTFCDSQGLTLLDIDNFKCSSCSLVMMGGTSKRTHQTVSKQESLKAEFSSLRRWTSLMNIYK